MPPSHFYRDRWPYPASGNPQNPPTWTQSQVHPPRHLPPNLPQNRLSPYSMNESTSGSQVPQAMIRLRTGPNHTHMRRKLNMDHILKTKKRIVISQCRCITDTYIGDWIRPPVSDDGVAAQLTGRIEMLRERIGAVERSREQDQRAGWTEPTTQAAAAHQGVRWAYPAENRPGFWEVGYGAQYGYRQLEHMTMAGRNPPGSAFQPVVSSSPLIRSNVPPPVALPPSETDVPPAPAVLLLRPNIALFSTDAMPVNCSPQPIAGQQPVYEDFERHPQDITDLLQQTNIVSPAEPQEEVLYARYFLPPKSMAMDVHPEKNAPERSADITSTQSSPAQPLPRTCECLTQTLSCHGCGAGIGYMIVTPCARCTAQQSISGRPGQPQRTANGHRFVFHHAEIVARERLYIPGQPGVHRYPWGIPPTASSQPNATMGQQSDSRSRVPSVDSEPKSPSIPVFQPHRDGNFIPIVSQVPARPLTRRIQNSGLKAGDVVFWHHLSRTGELGGVSLDDEYYSQHFVER
ncbi:hypothetical protein RhiXN_06507 [Rhizoctonia solani]|uniref:Uncharacterized protein n=1 Tax=Rhizoctonia solani TaxID=456999 RepID=A0A8H8P0A4_9AGAM|nr:uncharacterized protein RhiXN_06507 [Rhizoctonia solani]QRW21518.1 hypothetical protein RhiXN_06507 [Rhizoctonia solani]